MITSILLENFKCFRKTDEIPFRQITLLTGSNGRGKSSLFQALLLLAQSASAGKNIEHLKFNGHFVALGTFEDVLRRQAEDEVFSIALTSDDVYENRVKFVCEQDSVTSRKAQFRHFYVLNRQGESDDLMEQVGDSSESSYEGRVMQASSSVTLLGQLSNVLYVSADRQGPTSYVEQIDNEDVDPVGIHGEYAINTLCDKQAVLEAVKKDLSYVMGGASLSASELNADYIKLLIDSKDGQDGFKPINVGFGYSYILPIIVAPHIAESNSKIFIENPEAHLHPGAQSRLMEVLIRLAKQKNLQLFIETHSDHIINALRIAVKFHKDTLEKEEASIIHITRENEDVEPIVWPISINENGDLSNYPKDLQEEWGLQMIKLL